MKKLKFDSTPIKYTHTSQYLSMKKRKINDLDEVRPRRKGIFTLKINERQEVKDVLYPYIKDFIFSRLSFRKMPPKSQNDPRKALMCYFTLEKSYPMGKLIINLIIQETEEKFTKDEIINVLINTIYRYHIDYLSFIFKSHSHMSKTNKIDKQKATSIWDKISEITHV